MITFKTNSKPSKLGRSNLPLAPKDRSCPRLVTGRLLLRFSTSVPAHRTTLASVIPIRRMGHVFLLVYPTAHNVSTFPPTHTEL